MDVYSIHVFIALSIKVVFFSTNSVFGSLLSWNVHSLVLTQSSENIRFGRSLKPSTAKSRRFPRLSRALRHVSKLAVSLLAKPSVKFEFELGK